MKRIITHKSFEDAYVKLPTEIQRRVDKKIKLLAENLSHPSLRVKKVKGKRNIYEGSINMGYRFLFLITENAYILLRIGRHDILENL